MIVNYFIIIGNKVFKEVFSFDEVIEWFDLKNFFSFLVYFNLKYLKYLNYEYLKFLDDEKLLEFILIKDKNFLGFLRLFIEECGMFLELKEKILLFLELKDIVKIYENEDFKECCLVFFNVLKSMDF